jgi:hypothetical protein
MFDCTSCDHILSTGTGEAPRQHEHDSPAHQPTPDCKIGRIFSTEEALRQDQQNRLPVDPPIRDHQRDPTAHRTTTVDTLHQHIRDLAKPLLRMLRLSIGATQLLT